MMLLMYLMFIIAMNNKLNYSRYIITFNSYYLEMEELLNKLIEKGWKPFGREARHELSSWVVYDTIDIKGKWDIRVIDRRHHHIRELVSKESWLWQFCAENRLINSDDNYVRKWEQQCRYVYDDYDCWEKSQLYSDDYDYEYRLIESALRDESELEYFLLSNIKVDVENK